MTRAGDDRPMMDHEYDGIQEYDNPMPRWWLLLFAVTIVFVPVYYLLPSDIGNITKADMYTEEIAAFNAAHPEAPKMTAEQVGVFVGKADAIADGKVVFMANCVACHRADGGGQIGPNLTDDFWIHGATPLAIHTTITEGVLAKGMPPWGKMLKPEQINSVMAYVISLHGSHPTNPKEPQGILATAEAAKP